MNDVIDWMNTNFWVFYLVLLAFCLWVLATEDQ